MSDEPNQQLLEALLNSWDRNNTILLNLLRVLPEGGRREGRLASLGSADTIAFHKGSEACSETSSGALG